MTRETYTIDAKNKSLGRLATEIAILLRGKNKPDFSYNKDEGGFVVVKNFKKVKFSGNKFTDKKYYRHSGYPGGIKEIPLNKLFEKSPNLVLKKAVFGMLPKNKLRSQMIKRLKVEL